MAEQSQIPESAVSAEIVANHSPTGAALTILGGLLGATAHELNNILGILGLRLEKLQSTAAPSADSARDYEVLGRNLSRAAALLEDLLELRPREGSGRPAPDQPAAMVFAGATKVLRALYEKKMSFAEDFANAGTLYPGDPVQLRMLVIAVLQSLIQRVPAHGSAVEINARSESGSLRLEASIRAGADSGLPQPAAGTLASALALEAAAQRLCADLGGQLRFETPASTPGTSRVSLRLPLA